MTSPHRFVLEAIDLATECCAFDTAFDVPDLEVLRVQLHLDPADFDPNEEFELDDADLDRIRRAFAIEFEPGEFQTLLRPFGPADELPYKIHTGRELRLMLNGTKPLAAFIDEHPSNPEYELVPERLFDPYVKAGRFSKHESIYSQLSASGQELKYRRVLYALQEEQWRIPAYELLWKTAEKSGWNEGLERMQGSLLGYEDWQNDAHIEGRRPSHLIRP